MVFTTDLRSAIQREYAEVAEHPERAFHFHTGRPLARRLRYDPTWLVRVPESVIASFAGTGNPFSLGPLYPDDNIVDVGSGAGLDSLIAARLVAPSGHVIGVDVTPTMLEKARLGAKQARVSNVEFHAGLAEDLPVESAWADVVISNGVLNLVPDKAGALAEMARVLRPNGRLQVADIIVQRPVPESAKGDIDLWTG